MRADQTGEIVASTPIRMVKVRKPPRKIAILYMSRSLMRGVRCTGRFGMRSEGDWPHCRGILSLWLYCIQRQMKQKNTDQMRI